jgi:hypothetical protein
MGNKFDFKDVLEELEAWLPSESEEFVELVARILASLPGGEVMKDMGYKPFLLGWKEADLLGRLLVSLEDSSNVARAVATLFARCPYCGAEIDYPPPQWETISPPCGGDPAWHDGIPEEEEEPSE